MVSTMWVLLFDGDCAVFTEVNFPLLALRPTLNVLLLDFAIVITSFRALIEMRQTVFHWKMRINRIF